MENSGLMKKTYSKYAFSAAMFMLAAVIVQLFNNIVLTKLLPESFVNSSVYAFFNIIFPEYFLLKNIIIKTIKLLQQTTHH